MKTNFKKHIVILSLVFIVPLIITYFVFAPKGFIPAGDVDKNTWLSFWGGFLAFYGAISLGYTSVWQTKKANELSEKMINLELKSKMGYFEFCKFHSPEIKIELCNIGDDYIKVNDVVFYRGQKKLIPKHDLGFCKNSCVLPDQNIVIRLLSVAKTTEEFIEKRLPYTMVIFMENSRGYRYKQVLYLTSWINHQSYSYMKILAINEEYELYDNVETIQTEEQSCSPTPANPPSKL